jgi:hypothetical protein
VCFSLLAYGGHPSDKQSCSRQPIRGEWCGGDSQQWGWDAPRHSARAAPAALGSGGFATASALLAGPAFASLSALSTDLAAGATLAASLSTTAFDDGFVFDNHFTYLFTAPMTALASHLSQGAASLPALSGLAASLAALDAQETFALAFPLPLAGMQFLLELFDDVCQFFPVDACLSQGTDNLADTCSDCAATGRAGSLPANRLGPDFTANLSTGGLAPSLTELGRRHEGKPDQQACRYRPCADQFAHHGFSFNKEWLSELYLLPERTGIAQLREPT